MVTTRTFERKVGIEVDNDVTRFPAWRVYGVAETPALLEVAIVSIAIAAKERAVSVSSHTEEMQKMKKVRSALVDLSVGPVANLFKTISASLKTAQRSVDQLRETLQEQVALILSSIGDG